MRTEPADEHNAAWLLLTYRDGSTEQLFYQKRTWALGILTMLPLMARTPGSKWADVARAKLQPAIVGGMN